MEELEAMQAERKANLLLNGDSEIDGRTRAIFQRCGVFMSPNEARKLRRLSILAGFDRKWSRSSTDSTGAAQRGCPGAVTLKPMTWALSAVRRARHRVRSYRKPRRDPEMDVESSETVGEMAKASPVRSGALPNGSIYGHSVPVQCSLAEDGECQITQPPHSCIVISPIHAAGAHFQNCAIHGHDHHHHHHHQGIGCFRSRSSQTLKRKSAPLSPTIPPPPPPPQIDDDDDPDDADFDAEEDYEEDPSSADRPDSPETSHRYSYRHPVAPANKPCPGCLNPDQYHHHYYHQFAPVTLVTTTGPSGSHLARNPSLTAVHYHHCCSVCNQALVRALSQPNVGYKHHQPSLKRSNTLSKDEDDEEDDEDVVDDEDIIDDDETESGDEEMAKPLSSTSEEPAFVVVPSPQGKYKSVAAAEGRRKPSAASTTSSYQAPPPPPPPLSAPPPLPLPSKTVTSVHWDHESGCTTNPNSP